MVGFWRTSCVLLVLLSACRSHPSTEAKPCDPSSPCSADRACVAGRCVAAGCTLGAPQCPCQPDKTCLLGATCTAGLCDAVSLQSWALTIPAEARACMLTLPKNIAIRFAKDIVGKVEIGAQHTGVVLMGQHGGAVATVFGKGAAPDVVSASCSNELGASVVAAITFVAE